GLSLPSTYNKWNGLSNADNTSLNGYGLQPPDMALAAAPNGTLLQAVNAVIAVYDINGTVQGGWPKRAASFFGAPAPRPVGCDGGLGPFMSDRRAWYDPFDNRFGVAMLEVEGAFGVNNCAEVSKYWIAISNTSNPTGTWTVFSINMLGLTSDPTAAADFTQFGFNADGI